MNEINLLKKIICECQYTNTYKFAWIRAIVEISNNSQIKDSEKGLKIEFNEISKYIFKYYWNQIIKYNWIQSSNIDKQPKIITDIKNFMNIIKTYRKLDIYSNMEYSFQNEFFLEYKRSLNKICTTLKKDVSWRFLYYNKKNYTNLYQYNKGNLFLFISRNMLIEIKKEYLSLLDIVDYRWGLVIESYNEYDKIHKNKIEYIDLDLNLLKSLRKKLCFEKDIETNQSIKENNNIENIKIIIHYDSKYKFLNMKK